MSFEARRAVAFPLEQSRNWRPGSGYPDEEPRLLIATGRYIGEGFDDARLDTLFLAMPVSWKGTLVQYAGRLHRLHPGKTEVRIYDYVDRDVPCSLGCSRSVCVAIVPSATTATPARPPGASTMMQLKPSTSPRPQMG